MFIGFSVAVTNAFLQSSRKCFQHLVANIMAIGVVDVLKIVDIEKNQRSDTAFV